MKHIKSFLLTLLATLLALPATARDFEFEGLTYTVLDEESKTCETKAGTLTSSIYAGEPGNYVEGNVIIPSTVSDGSNSYTVVKLGSYSFIYCPDLISISIPESVLTFDSGVFAGCSSLIQFNFPESLTKLGTYTFYKCASLDSITIPDNIEFIGAGSFGECSNLTKVNLPNKLSSIEGSTFRNCTSLSTLNIPLSVSSIGNEAFGGCNVLTSISIPESVESIGRETFADCTQLSSIHLPSTLTSIGYHAFYRCSALTSISIPNEVYTIGAAAFYECSGLTTVELPQKLESVPSSLFQRCTNLKSIEIPESVTTIGNEAFFGCMNLTTVSVPESVVSIGSHAFSACSSLYEISLPNELSKIESGTFSSCSNLKLIDIPDSVKSIGTAAFYNCSSLTEITIPARVDSIGNNAFNFDGLASVMYKAIDPIQIDENVFNTTAYSTATLNMPNATLADIQATTPWNKFSKVVAKEGSIGFGASAGEDFEYEGIWYTVLDAEAKTVKTKDGHFEDGSNTSYQNVTGDITIPEMVSDGVNDYTVIGIGRYSFSGCSNLITISLPNTLEYIEPYGFSTCIRLNSVSLPSSLELIDEYSFSLCNLKEVTIPEKITTITWGTFQNCLALEKVILPETVTVIEVDAFYGCNSLEFIELPASLKYIYRGAFNNCALRSIELPSSLELIGEMSFQLNPLVFVTIPANLQEAGETPFLSCTGINEVTYMAETPVSFDEKFFDESVYENATLNMPNATLADVQATTPWNKFSKIVAKDGSVGFAPGEGEDFEYEGIWYTVLDAEAKTVKTKEGGYVESELLPGNNVEGEIEIPATVYNESMSYTVVEIGQIGFFGTGITSIKLPNSINKIGNSAFYNCESLSQINFPESIVSIEVQAFVGCKSLITLDFPESLSSIGIETFQGCIGLTSVNFKSSIETIGSAVFEGCTGLTTLTLPESLKTIESGAFNGCSNLDSLNFPKSLKSIGDHAFMWCINLTLIELHESFETIGEGSFYHCENLVSINLPLSLSTIGTDAFSGCYNLTEITYNADTPIIADEGIFTPFTYESATLKTPNATLEAVQAVSPWNKFLHITAADGSIEPSLAEGEDFEYEGIWYTVIDADAKTVKTKDGHVDEETGEYVAGNACESALVIPAKVSDGTDEYSVAEIGLFSFCNSPITSLSLPENLGYISHAAFYGCKSLTAVNLPEGLTRVGPQAFMNCEALSEVTFPSTLKVIEGLAFNLCGFSTLVIPEGIEVVQDFSLSQNYQLASLTIPASLTEIGEWAFSNEPALTEVTYNAVTPLSTYDNVFSEEAYRDVTLNMPNATLADIQSTAPWNQFKRIIASDGSIMPGLAAGDDFEYEGIIYTVLDAEAKTVKTKDGQDSDNPGNRYVGALAIPPTVTYDNYEYTVVEIGQRSFCSLSGLTSVSLPSTVVKLGEAAFEGCENLVSIELPDSLREVEGFVFDSCVALTSITLPEGMEYVGERMFAHCTSLTSAILPSTIREIRGWAFGDANLIDINLPDGLETIGGEALTQNRNLASIEIPNTVTAILDRAFSTTALTSLIIPESVQHLGDGAFYHCYELESVVIPASIQSIGLDAFGEGDNKLVSVTYNAEQPIEASDWVFGQSGETYDRATLYMPNATLADVQAITPWNLFKHIQASDGSVGFGSAAGEDFEFEGIWYTVLDAEAKTVKTKDGYIDEETGGRVSGNDHQGDLVIPAKVSNGTVEYSVVEIGMFGFCDSQITSLSLPENLEFIGWDAFRECKNLTVAYLPEGLLRIGIRAFMDCESLSEVAFPNTLKVIENLAFTSCGFTSLSIPEGIEIIKDHGFSYNLKLTSLTIPGSLTEIGEWAFSSEPALTEVTYNAATPLSAPENVFSEEGYGDVILNMPNASLADVKATTPWNLFKHIVASDGSVEPGPETGQTIEVDGMAFTVIDSDQHLLRTNAGSFEEGRLGNTATGNFIIPETVTYDGQEYTVTEIGGAGFWGNPDLLSVTIPGSITGFGGGEFYGCERLTSIVWQGSYPLPIDVLNSAENPNILLYVNDLAYAPDGLDRNVVAGGVCDNLVLTPGYPFTPVAEFTSEHSEITKRFSQQTPIGGSAGWETLAIPFEPAAVTASDGRALVPFPLLTDIETQCPFWLYEADPAGEWKEASGIHQSVPYILSMPNNDEYDAQYCVNGDVTFTTDEKTLIAPETCAPYAATWASGREFRSLWLPLSKEEAATAMGLNVGVSGLTDDEGQVLLPGSAFSAEVLPKPLEAYVTRIDARRAMPVRGGQSFVRMMSADNGLRIAVDLGEIILSSDADRIVDVFTMEGIAIRHAELKAGQPYRIEGLTRGIYLVAGRKITIK